MGSEKEQPVLIRFFSLYQFIDPISGQRMHKMIWVVDTSEWDQGQIFTCVTFNEVAPRKKRYPWCDQHGTDQTALLVVAQTCLLFHCSCVSERPLRRKNGISIASNIGVWGGGVGTGG